MIRALKNIFRKLKHTRLHKVDVRMDFRVIGSEYGGWPILSDTKPGDVIFSFGVGEDISFDLGAIKGYGCIVHGFDPTPRSRRWIENQILPEQFIFHPIGIAGDDGTAEFHPPVRDDHVSFSALPKNGEPSGDVVTAEVKKLDTIRTLLNNLDPEIVKMDIEGFEYSVVESLSAGSVRPRQMLIEFHHGMYGHIADETIDAVAKLKKMGYEIFYISSTGHEYGFCLR